MSKSSKDETNGPEGQCLSVKRLVSIDVLRALSILAMIQIHFVAEFSDFEPSSGVLWAVWVWFLGDLPAPIFSFLLGLSLYLWLQKKKASDWSKDQVAKAVVRRGLFLFMLGLAFVTFIWRPKYIFTWEILTFLGSATVLLLPLRNWSVKRLLMLVLLVMVVSPPLRAVTDYSSFWGGESWEYYDPKFTIFSVTLGYLLHGYVPVFPWIVFPLMGFIVGKQLTSSPDGKVVAGPSILSLGLVFGCLGGISMALARTMPSSLKGYFCSPSYAPTSTSYICIMVGVFCLGFWILNRYLDNREGSSQKFVLSSFQRYSAFSLTTYVVHHMVIVWPLYVIALCRGEVVHYYLSNAVSTPTAVLLAVVFIIVFDRLLVVWTSLRKYSLEGLLRWLM